MSGMGMEVVVLSEETISVTSDLAGDVVGRGGD